jgi:hypothetical protein
MYERQPVSTQETLYKKKSYVAYIGLSLAINRYWKIIGKSELAMLKGTLALMNFFLCPKLTWVFWLEHKYEGIYEEFAKIPD